MHINLPYPNIFTRKKIYICIFLFLEMFFQKINFSTCFPVSVLKRLQNWWFSKKSFLIHETSTETWFKCQVTDRKKCMFVRFFQKIFGQIYLHDNYRIKNQKCLHIHSMNPSPCGPLASIKKTTPYSNQEKNYDFFFSTRKNVKKYKFSSFFAIFS